MTDDHSRSESMWLGDLEFRDRSLEGSNRSAGNGRHRNGSGVGDPGVISGLAVSGAEKAASDRAADAAPPGGDRSHVPPGVLEAMRKQVADFADFAHRTRIAPPNSADALQALGSGGGITAAVVETIADVLDKAGAGLGADNRALTDSLLLSLVAPREPDQLTEHQLESFATWRGRLALDVSMAEIGDEPKIRLVRLDDHPERQLPAGDGQVSRASDQHLTAPCAVVIIGSAAYIAGDRPYLSLDSLMTFARSKAYRSGGSAGEPAAPGTGLQAARNLEIVVLLDKSLGGGLWIDVDRATGRVAAALAIGLSPTGIQFTHVPRLRAPDLRAQPAAIASS